MTPGVITCHVFLLSKVKGPTIKNWIKFDLIFLLILKKNKKCHETTHQLFIEIHQPPPAHKREHVENQMFRENHLFGLKNKI
jgi:hypothetical protein